MFHRVLPLVMIVTVVPWLAAAQPQFTAPPDPARAAFAQAWVGHKVTLVAPLYSVISTATTTTRLGSTRDGRVLLGTNENAPEQSGVNALANDGRRFYRHLDFSAGIQEVSDANIDRFLDRLNAIRRRVSPAKLVTYAAGETLVVKSVEWNRRLLSIQLFDPVASGVVGPSDATATSISILWPVDLSADLSEAEQLTHLLNTLVSKETPTH